jgi:integrase/recombinase XerD
MFEVLFKNLKHASRHREGPWADARERYLVHCANYGATRSTLIGLASRLLIVAQCIDVTPGRTITLQDVDAAAHNWARSRRRSHHVRHRSGPRNTFVQVATAWLRFLGCLEGPRNDTCPFAEQLDDFAAYQCDERGLSPNTIEAQRRQLKDFLKVLIARKSSLAQVTIDDIDQFLDLKGRQGCCRITIRTRADTLRSFFRYAELRGWCSHGICTGIDAPRVFKYEGLPSSPAWEDVQRVIADADRMEPRDIRDRAILMLLAIYGLRSGEVSALRVPDLDWIREIITIRRPKQRRTHCYPLVTAVGDAILLYLQQGRPRSAHRELFLTLRAPFRPLSRICLYNLVSKRLRPLNIQVRHHGPHCLRHACASHLLAEGVSLKEIGDHLGHRSTAATRVYAKVDLAGLREVADFDLRGLS